MWRQTFVSVAVSIVASGTLVAQTGTITGTVTSADGARPIAGAQVSVLGTSRGGMTADDGRYSIVIDAGTYRVRARRIGFTPDSATGVVVTSGGTTIANFQLVASAQVLGEVVAIGYGTTQARDLTGSVSTTTSREFNTGRVVSPEELIRAKVPGVQVVDNNEPGGGITIRIRGGTSATASNDPLYVVDGMPLEVGGGASAGRNPLNFLNPQDIASVTVLKDASSTAIYGSRGANGVVIITTKSGATGPQFTYTGTMSGSSVTGGPDMVSASQYRAAVQQYAPSRLGMVGNANTNWLKAVEQNARGMEHNVSFASRHDEMNYRLGFGYLDQSGVLQGTNTQRASISLNYDDRLFNTLNIRTHIKGSRTKDLFTPGGVLGNAIAFPSTQPIVTGTGSYYEYLDPSGKPLTLVPSNPLGDLAQIQDQGSSLRSVGNVEAEYAIPYITGLSATVRGGFDVVRADRTTFTPTTAYSQLTGSNPGDIYRNSPGQQKTVLDAYANYTRPVDQLKSTVDVTAGYSAERFRGDYPSFNAAGLSTNLLGLYGVPVANDSRPFYGIEESRLLSGFGRANWNLLDRYLFTATFRRDGSSKFAKGNQYGTFPSAAFAWRLLNEPFLEGKTPLSDLKFRIAWGKNGNQSVANYVSYLDYAYGQVTSQAQFGNEFVTTIRPSAKDKNLKWEETASTNVGFDYGFAQDRVTGTIDYYNKKTTRLLFDVPTAAGQTLSNHVVTNIGSVQNRGVELALNAKLFEGGKQGFNWDANFNASANRNKLLSIDRPGIPFIKFGGISGGVGTTIQVFEPGIPIGSFFVYQHIRQNGKPIYADVNGDGVINEQDLYVDQNKDGIINTADLRPYKSPTPKWILGHTSNMSWMGFDASTTLRAYLGNYVYNNVASNLGHYSVLRQGNAPVNLHASVIRTGFVDAQPLSDVYIEDGSFLRMDNITLGYTFGSLHLMQGSRVLDGLRLFGTVQNVFTKTKYTGVDPTANIAGIDNNVYPRSRTVVGGLSLQF